MAHAMGYILTPLRGWTATRLITHGLRHGLHSDRPYGARPLIELTLLVRQ